MTDEIADVIKHREIGFRGPHPDARQAHSATLLLHDVDGIMHVKPLDDMRIAVSYDLRKLTLAELEAALQEIGFHLDNGVLYKLKRASSNVGTKGQYSDRLLLKCIKREK